MYKFVRIQSVETNVIELDSAVDSTSPPPPLIPTPPPNVQIPPPDEEIDSEEDEEEEEDEEYADEDKGKYPLHGMVIKNSTSLPINQLNHFR